MTQPTDIHTRLPELADALGFACVAIAPASPPAWADRFGRFLELGWQGEMAYLARDPAARSDPRRLLDGAASVICLAASYAPGPEDPPPGGFARYALGRDYHRVLRQRCRRLVDALREAVPDMRARICVDTAPLLERGLAALAGLGWIGRNGCVIHPRWGSYLLLAEIVTDLPLPAGTPAQSRCGRCRACVDACPTGAIGADGLVDARRCISYLTIEHRGSIPDSLRRPMGQRVFGCDVCQEVCPYNRRAPAGDAELRGPSALVGTAPPAILRWTREDWDRLTRGSAARRASFEMFLRNAAIAAGNAADASARPALRRLTEHPAPEVAEAARWALDQSS